MSLWTIILEFLELGTYILYADIARNAVKNSKVYPGADADSDHNLVAMELAIQLKFLKKHKGKKKWNTEKFKVRTKSSICWKGQWTYP